ncbi:hypothetical protein [Ensifer adhaerens]|uniref:hypothetical protein n=1 Tax=Ensifer adhaerens TaxID=106592 RepID=UPI000DC4664A|nr:hypothetical protein [Ensifer adhaerens]RAS13520.1 hypothetical protein DEU52_106118 [Ensifer adhaerens]
MTSALLTVSDAGQRSFNLVQFPAHLPCDVSFEMQPDDDHSLHLPIAVLAEGSEAYSDHIAIVGHLRDEICVGIRCSLIEYDNLRVSKLSDDGHQQSSKAMQVSA